ncbi:hypothetical protein CSKR_105313 [Clonorchis sinensis]|uniref:Uncharacterized protein n=1 Tax=Clonorchis sinensis TaxID=79923 RepID=A0A3R7DQ31_CLOSI|nr:hypothetical protein CSKR_105313 [Clonorchis sinensis]
MGEIKALHSFYNRMFWFYGGSLDQTDDIAFRKPIKYTEYAQQVLYYDKLDISGGNRGLHEETAGVTIMIRTFSSHGLFEMWIHWDNKLTDSPESVGSTVDHTGKGSTKFGLSAKVYQSIYRKSTDSGAVLNYSSAHPKAVYASIVSTMFRRVRALRTQEVDRRAAQLERIKCNDCTKVYIGQTVRELHTRIGEHKRSINRPPRNIDEYQAIVNDSAMAGYALHTGHRIDLENGNILRRGLRFTPQRLVAEAVEVAKLPSIVNHQLVDERLIFGAEISKTLKQRVCILVWKDLTHCITAVRKLSKLAARPTKEALSFMRNVSKVKLWCTFGGFVIANASDTQMNKRPALCSEIFEIQMAVVRSLIIPKSCRLHVSLPGAEKLVKLSAERTVYRIDTLKMRILTTLIYAVITKHKRGERGIRSLTEFTRTPFGTSNEPITRRLNYFGLLRRHNPDKSSVGCYSSGDTLTLHVRCPEFKPWQVVRGRITTCYLKSEKRAHVCETSALLAGQMNERNLPIWVAVESNGEPRESDIGNFADRYSTSGLQNEGAETLRSLICIRGSTTVRELTADC